MTGDGELSVDTAEAHDRLAAECDRLRSDNDRLRAAVRAASRYRLCRNHEPPRPAGCARCYADRLIEEACALDPAADHREG